jgi:hypothetical protein
MATLLRASETTANNSQRRKAPSTTANFPLPCHTILHSLPNAALIATVQKIEHYEIASYGCLRDWAAVLGHPDVADTLQKILDQDKATNHALTELARLRSNREALSEEALEDMLPTILS